MTEFVLAIAGASIVVAMGFAVYLSMHVLKLERQLDAALDQIEQLQSQLREVKSPAKAAGKTARPTRAVQPPPSSPTAR